VQLTKATKINPLTIAKGRRKINQSKKGQDGLATAIGNGLSKKKAIHLFQVIL